MTFLVPEFHTSNLQNPGWKLGRNSHTITLSLSHTNMEWNLGWRDFTKPILLTNSLFRGVRNTSGARNMQMWAIFRTLADVSNLPHIGLVSCLSCVVQHFCRTVILVGDLNLSAPVVMLPGFFWWSSACRPSSAVMDHQWWLCVCFTPVFKLWCNVCCWRVLGVFFFRSLDPAPGLLVVSPAGVSRGEPSGFSPRSCAVPSAPGDWCGTSFLWLSGVLCLNATVFCSPCCVFLEWFPMRCLVVVCAAGVSLDAPSGFSQERAPWTSRPRGLVWG